MFFLHASAIVAGFFLDLIIGDPYNIPHPVRWIGGLIGFLDRKLAGGRHERLKGLLLWTIVVSVTTLVAIGALFLAYLIHPAIVFVLESIMTCYCLATKSLRTESMKVYDALMTKDIEGARRAVSMIVGRDTDALDEQGIIRAAVETVAENTSDGVVAPLFYCIIGGPVLGLIYKAINTMDSMIGYHNERYEDFGFFAARFDDIVNFLPSRISAALMIISAALLGKDYDAKRALFIFKRDRFNHKSPNSAQTESVLAGALGVRLAGDAYYFGKLVKKPYIGDAKSEVETADIKRACTLMYTTAFLGLVIMLVIRVLVWGFLGYDFFAWW